MILPTKWKNPKAIHFSVSKYFYGKELLVGLVYQAMIQISPHCITECNNWEQISTCLAEGWEIQGVYWNLFVLTTLSIELKVQ